MDLDINPSSLTAHASGSHLDSVPVVHPSASENPGVGQCIYHRALEVEDIQTADALTAEHNHFMPYGGTAYIPP